MFQRLSLCALALLLLGCPPFWRKKPEPVQVPQCSFTINSPVSGITITSSGGATRTTVAGQPVLFTLACSAQTFQFSKRCYPTQRVTLTPNQGSKHTLTQSDWEQHGYFRVQNTSTEDLVTIRDLPGGPLLVPAKQHAVRRLALDSYAPKVTATYKEPVVHELELCTANEIAILQVDTQGPDGELTAHGGESIELEHGKGQLRVLTESPDLRFYLDPERSQGLRDYLAKVGVDFDLAEAPEALKEMLALLKRLNSGAFRAPTAIALPAGRYFITHNRQEEDAERLEIEVYPGQETRLELP